MISTKTAYFTKNMALAFYAQARSLRVPERPQNDVEYQLIALLLAAVWLGVEHGTTDPWVRRVDLPPALSRAAFMHYAASVFDLWIANRPAPTFAVLDGGKETGRDDG